MLVPNVLGGTLEVYVDPTVLVETISFGHPVIVGLATQEKDGEEEQQKGEQSHNALKVKPQYTTFHDSTQSPPLVAPAGPAHRAARKIVYRNGRVIKKIVVTLCHEGTPLQKRH
jgi:hypothetical protein